MKKFSIHIMLFSLVVILSILGLFSLADGTTDAMYLKFTSPKQSAIIIGASRAAQGIQPTELNIILDRNDIYNYAFQLTSSPYGKSYVESIKRKLDPKTTNGLFILDVNPWVISKVLDFKLNEEVYLEDDFFVSRTHGVSQDPNFEYLIESFDDKYVEILTYKFQKREVKTLFLENNGWLRVIVDTDSIAVKKRTERKLLSYAKKLERYIGVSEYRISYLKELISFLKPYGDVILVRLPVIKEMESIENKLQSEFDVLMREISENYDVPYINMMMFKENYLYTDGNHLDVNSGVLFSRDLANKIKSLQNDQ